MFKYLCNIVPKDIALVIIWDFINPIPHDKVKYNYRQLNQEFQNPLRYAIHQELLSTIERK